MLTCSTLSATTVTNLKIGIQTRSLRQPFKQAIRTAARLGADGVEIDARNELRPGELSGTGSARVSQAARGFEPARVGGRLSHAARIRRGGGFGATRAGDAGGDAVRARAARRCGDQSRGPGAGGCERFALRAAGRSANGDRHVRRPRRHAAGRADGRRAAAGFGAADRCVAGAYGGRRLASDRVDLRRAFAARGGRRARAARAARSCVRCRARRGRTSERGGARTRQRRFARAAGAAHGVRLSRLGDDRAARVGRSDRRD